MHLLWFIVELTCYLGPLMAQVTQVQVFPSQETLHETQSKILVVTGTGFTNIKDVKITLQPNNKAYKVLSVESDSIRLQLKPDQSWLSSFSSSLQDDEEGKKILISVISIDVGAGEIIFDTAVPVGYIIKDRAGLVCDDSCEFAFDGVCDDGSQPKDQYYYEGYQPDPAPGIRLPKPSVKYDDYYAVDEGEDYQVSACVLGTDCSDCGGVDAIIDYSPPASPVPSAPPVSAVIDPVPLDPGSTADGACTNTCIYPRDGVCDDPRGTKYCELGMSFLCCCFFCFCLLLLTFVSPSPSLFSQAPTARIAVPSALTTSLAPTTTAGGTMMMTTGTSMTETS